MKCSLCNKEKKLIRTSHIIPDFMYKGIYDEKHKLLPGQTKTIKNEKLISSAPYDQQILCQVCDNELIGQYETYASKALYGEKLNVIEQPIIERVKSNDGLESLKVSNISYTKFKLFILTILWRSSISKHSFFKEVNLGKYSEDFRNMIINGDASDDTKYQSGMIIVEERKDILTKVVFEPRQIKKTNGSFYLYFINGVYYYINVSNKKPPEIIDLARIKENNSIIIPVLKGNQIDSFYDSFVGTKLRIIK